MSARVLVVDDEPAIADAVAYSLRSEGYEVEARATGEEALQAATASHWDVLVLDVMLPGVSGIEVCRRLRADSDVPIILLTARDSEVDRVLGLEAGADDYVVKPFSTPELVSRVRAILRRRDLDRGISNRRVGRLELDLARHEARIDGRLIQLTPTEFRLLSFLASSDRTFTRHEVMRELWQSTYVGDDRAVDVHVGNIRRKLARDGLDANRLVTVRGVGYRLVPV